MESQNGKPDAPVFKRIAPEEDTVKQESVCSNCSQRLTAYTVELLREKELNHKCRVRQPEFHPRPAENVPKVKLY